MSPSDRTTDGSTVYYISQSRLLVPLLCAVALVITGIAMVAFGGLKAVIGGALAVLFFGFCAVLLGVQFVRRSPQLTISFQGLAFRNRSLGWHEIERIRLRHTGRQHALEVLPHHLENHSAGLSPAGRLLAQSNTALGYSPLTITAQTLSVSVDDIALTIRRYCPTLRIEDLRN
ncbi:STM3941 family protein [Nocardia sp. NPDC058058]|uniref:STM3941 family protein n=1 Tax=Nocardia sp. NPDC058058 TaxID=3346317 RepID=UPI0036D9CE02